MFRTIPRYEEDGLGLPYPVVLINAAEEELDDLTGKRIGISIPNLEGLIAAVAVSRSLIPLQLSGKEVRFFRQVLGISGKELARNIGLAASTLSRWENDKQSLGFEMDKLVRLIVIIAMGDRVPHLSADRKAIIGMEVTKRPPDVWPDMEMHRILPDEKNENGWDMSFAAAA